MHVDAEQFDSLETPDKHNDAALETGRTPDRGTEKQALRPILKIPSIRTKV